MRRAVRSAKLFIIMGGVAPYSALKITKYEILTNKKGPWRQSATRQLAKLGKNKNVTTDVLVRICRALECNIDDITDISEQDEKSKGEWEKCRV